MAMIIGEGLARLTRAVLLAGFDLVGEVARLLGELCMALSKWWWRMSITLTLLTNSVKRGEV